MTPHDNMFYSKKTNINDPQWTTSPWKEGEKVGKSRFFLCSGILTAIPLWATLHCLISSHTFSVEITSCLFTESKHWREALCDTALEKESPEFPTEGKQPTACSNPAWASSACGPEPKLTARQMRHRKIKNNTGTLHTSGQCGQASTGISVNPFYFLLQLHRGRSPSKMVVKKLPSMQKYAESFWVYFWAWFLFVCVCFIFFCFKNCGLKTYFL